MSSGRIKSTQEQFLEKVILVHDEKYDYSKSKYILSNINIEIICHEKDEFGKEHGSFWQRPRDHLNKQGCPKCSKVHKSTLEEFIKKANKIHNGFYYYGKFIYINIKTKGIIICPIHGEFLCNPWEHINKRICHECGKLNQEKFIERSISIHGIKYDYSKVNYINYSSKIEIICHTKDKNRIEHGSFFQSPAHHLQGKGCKKCSGIEQLTNEVVDERLKQKNRNLIRIGNYINSTAKIKWKCLICNYIWQSQPNNILNGTSCPHCNLSKGELEVEKFLKNFHTIYKSQVKFDDCRNPKTNRRLEYDFGIYDIYGSLICLIEFDGKHHFIEEHLKKNDSRYNLKNFKEIQYRDNLKNEYCIKNNIKLIRIPYWDFKNIEEILKRELNIN